MFFKSLGIRHSDLSNTLFLSSSFNFFKDCVITNPRLSLILKFLMSSDASPASVHNIILESSSLKLSTLLVSSGIKAFC